MNKYFKHGNDIVYRKRKIKILLLKSQETKKTYIKKRGEKKWEI